MDRCFLWGIVLTVLALSTSSFAFHGYVQQYTEEDGLGGSLVEWVGVESDGTKWFGYSSPSKGVTRFDEMNWDTFPLGQSFTDMTLDSHGRVWVALLFTPGFAYLENGHFHLLPHVVPTIKCASAVMLDPQGNLWGGGYGGGVSRGDISFVGQCRNVCQQGMGWTFWETDGIPLRFDLDLQGRVWLAGLYGLFRQSLDGKTWEQIGEIDQNGVYNYYEVLVSQTGRVWVSRRLNREAGPLSVFYSDDAPDYLKWEQLDFPILLESGANILNSVAMSEGVWFRYQDGAMCYHDLDWRLFPFHTHVVCAAEDGTTGDVWFGTNDGVYVMRGGPDAWPPVWVELEPGVEESRGAQAFTLTGEAEFQMDLSLDLYLAVQLPDGTILYAPNWTPSMTPSASSVDVPIGLTLEGYPILELDFTAVPTGTYRWYAAFKHAGTMDFASNIASCEWKVE